MSQSLSKLYVHLIFHIKNNNVYIKDEDKTNLYKYIGTIIKDNDSIPLLIDGTKDHLHILCIMSKNLALAKLAEETKRHSSRWIKTRGKHYQYFSWQGGYAGFSISPSQVTNTEEYIRNQEEHHKTRTFKEEYLLFLKEYDITYNEDYLWSDS